VETGNHGNRDDERPLDGGGNLPFQRDQICAEDSHACKGNEAYQPREPEPIQDLGNLEKEVRPLDFLLGCAPGDVI